MRADTGQRNRAGGIAGDNDDVRRQAFDQCFQHRIHTNHQCFLVLGAIGKCLVVAGVEQFAARTFFSDLVENTEAANTGIEHQYPRRRIEGSMVHGPGFYSKAACLQWVGPPGSDSARMRAMNLVIEQQQVVLFCAGLAAGGLLAATLLQLRHGRFQALQQGLIEHLSSDLQRQELALEQTRESVYGLDRENAALSATLDSERQRFSEQLQLLQRAREDLGREFENLANRIFEDKQASFNRHSKIALDTTVDPLRREIADFRQKVEDVYQRENAERNRLSGQVIELQKQAQRIGDDAIQLANALKGGNKIQGNWGEVVLERILEGSGLRRGSEYQTQVNLSAEDGNRRNPDVIVHLPDGRDIVIDAKVSLTGYEKFCREEIETDREQSLKAHLMSLRAHINGLSRKAYENLDGINSLDFVLIFVPVEAAFILAVENDQNLFRDAYERGIILVSPSTLMATLRTINNIWRFDDQNRNARKIARQAGAIYDQFVLVAESLEDVGRQIDRSQIAWQQTRRRLLDGRGNLVKRLEDLKSMGARTRRSMPTSLRDEALDQTGLESATGSSESLTSTASSIDEETIS